MAKSKFKVRTVKSVEDRKRPSVFLALKTDEHFKGHALFEPDPELEDNPGFYEYYRHWDTQANQEVPCVGDKCPFCKANDNPSTVALTLWNTEDGVKVFRMNYSSTQDMADISEEEEGIIGKHFRVKRLTDKGEYRFRPTTSGAKKLTKKQIAELLKDAPDLEEIVARNAKVQMERLAALDALEDDVDDDEIEDDDEDEEDEPKSKTRRGKKVEDDEIDDDDDEDEDEDDDVEEDDESDDESDDDDDDEDSDEDEDDDDEDEDEDEDDEDEDDESESLDSVEFEVVKFQEKDEVFSLKNKDYKKLEAWLGEGVDAPDDVKKGSKVTVSAVQDDEGDWVITKIAMKKGRGRPKGSKNKK